MIRFERCVGAGLLVLTATLVGPSAAAKIAKPGLPSKQLPQELPQETAPVDAPKQEAPPEAAKKEPLKKEVLPSPGNLPAQMEQVPPPAAPPPPQAPPEPKGWPNKISTASEGNCAREPGPKEVIVYRDPGFTGRCAVLTPGFYPFAENFLVGNDAITGIKVGKQVRARVFKDPVYSGSWTTFGPESRSAGVGGFNDKISSIRVEPANRSESCDDLREGEIALYEHPRQQGDCVVLPGVGSYPNAENMGIRNDGISSLRNNSGLRLLTFWHPSFGQQSLPVEPHTKVDSLPTDGLFTTGINDNISSIRMVQ